MYLTSLHSELNLHSVNDKHMSGKGHNGNQKFGNKIRLTKSVLFFTGSTYSCVAIAIERYLGICFSQSNWNIRRSCYYVMVILVATVVIDGPRYFTGCQNGFE